MSGHESQTPDKKKPFKKRVRRATMKFGKWITRAVSNLQSRQSLIEDTPVIDAAQFPFTAMLEEHWREVCEEAKSILAYREQVPLFSEVSTDQTKIAKGNTWRTFFLFGFGDRIDSTCAHAPRTAALIEQIPNVQNAFFSILEPGSHIPAHRGVTKGMLTCHLPLIVPEEAEKCRIRILEQFEVWRAGRMLIFDDSVEHEVWNDSNEIRVVLLFHVDRPMRPLGRALHKTLIYLIKKSAYVTEPRQRLQSFEDRFEAAVKRANKMLENADAN